MQKVQFLLVIFNLVACSVASGQSNRQPPIQLTHFEFTHSAALEGSGIGLTRIGSHGFFYAQVIVGFHYTTTIKRISFDGGDVTRYDVGRISRPMYLSDRSPFIDSFCIGQDGSVDILTDWYKGRLPGIFTIVVFDADGSVSSIVPVPLKNTPQVMHFAQFGDGRYLLVASHMGAGFFDRVDALLISSTGKVLRQKSLRKLSSAEEKAAVRDLKRNFDRREAQQKSSQGTGSRPASSSALKDGNKSGKKAATRPDYAMLALYSATVLIRGDDGSIYMARPDRPGKLYRISESGDMTPVPLSARQKPVALDPHWQLMSGIIRNGELMLCYARFDLPADSPELRRIQRVVIKTYNLESRQLIATYTGAKPHISSAVIGWDGDAFYFLHYAKSGQHGGYEIEKATP